MASELAQFRISEFMFCSYVNPEGCMSAIKTSMWRKCPNSMSKRTYQQSS